MNNTKISIRAMTAWKFSDEKRPTEVETALTLVNTLIEENVSLQFQVEALSEMQKAFADQLSKMQATTAETKYSLNMLIPYAKQSNMSGIDSAITIAEKLIGK